MMSSSELHEYLNLQRKLIVYLKDFINATSSWALINYTIQSINPITLRKAQAGI